MTRKLTPKQQRFVSEYLCDLNGTQAAIRAGYAAGSAKVTASRLLTSDNVQAALQVQRTALEQATGITQERVLAELAKLGFSDIRKIFDEDGRLKNIHELDDDTAGAMASIEVVTKSLGDGDVEYVHKIKMADKRGALVDIGKHLGMWEQAPAAPPVGDINVTINNVEVNLTQVRQELGDIFDEARGSAVEPSREH